MSWTARQFVGGFISIDCSCCTNGAYRSLLSSSGRKHSLRSAHDLSAGFHADVKKTGGCLRSLPGDSGTCSLVSEWIGTQLELYSLAGLSLSAFDVPGSTGRVR